MRTEWRNINEVLVEMQGPLDDVSKEGAELIAAEMKSLVPVDTGTLQNSIKVKKSRFAGGGYIIQAQGSGDYERYYASFVEFGSHPGGGKTYKPDSPFMRPAVKKYKRKIARMYQEVLN